AGKTVTIEAAFNAIRRGGGRCLFASHPAAGDKISLDPFELICGKRIEGSWGGATDPDRDFPRYAELFRQGKLPLEKLVTHRYSLDNINIALDDIRAGKVGRALIDVAGDV
ncbi:MAG: acetoin dehydrogenase, partial [Planctomycetes bacterium]|nr:acetoin dehydrogenase [Planctomycetota bacterium]